MKRLFNMLKKTTWSSDSKLRKASRRRSGACRLLGQEQLEDRRVFAIEFGSVLGIGNGETVSAALDVAADTAGNRYVTGYFAGQVDFDENAVHPGDVDILMAEGTTDAYLAKYAPDDSLLWVRRFGSDYVKEGATPTTITDRGSRVDVDSSGNVYVAGTFEGLTQFGAISKTSGNGRDGFLTKLNSSGAVQWVQTWDNDDLDNALALDVHTSGNLALMTSGVDWTWTELRKYSPMGALSWKKLIDTNWTAQGDIAIDSTGAIYVTGTFSGTVDFDPGSKTTNKFSNLSSSYVLKLTTSGAFSWVSAFQGGYSFGGDIALDGSNNVIVGGFYNNTSTSAVDFNPGSGVTNLASRGAYLTKLNNSGSLVWAKGLNVSSTDNAGIGGIVIDSSGAIYVSGGVSGTVDLDPSNGVAAKTSNGGSDVFVAKYSSTGAYQWGESFGGAGNESARLALDGTGNIHLAGAFQYTVDFDAGAGDSSLSTNGTTSKGFLKKLRPV